MSEDQDPQVVEGSKTPSVAGVDLARSLLAAAKAKQNSAPSTEGPSRGKKIKRDPQRGGEPKLLGAALAGLAADRGWEAEMANSTLLLRWPEIVGADFAAHVQAISISGGVLTLRAESTAWATQTRLLASDLLKRVITAAQLLPGQGPFESIRSIKVLGPAAPSWRKGERHVKGRGPRDTYG